MTFKAQINTVEDVLSMFGKGLDCGQVIVYAIASDLGIDTDMALKSAAAFGAGVFQGEICGSYIGGLIALGLKYGHSKEDDPAKGQMISKIFQYKEKYEKIQKSSVCSDILGYNLSIPEESKILEEKGLLTTVCPKLTLDIINIVRSL